MKTIFRNKLQTALSAFVLGGASLALGLVPAFASPPSVAPIPTLTGNEETLISYQVVASDPDADTLFYSLSNEPNGASIDSSTGAFTFTPDEDQGPATYNFFVNVNDDTNPTVQTQIKVIVKEVNTAPFINESIAGPYDLQENEENSIFLSRNNDDFGDVDEDAEGDRLQQVTVTASNLPAGAKFFFDKDDQDLFLTWTPTEAQGGKSYNVTFKVSDGSLSTSRTITFNVLKNNSAPILQTISDKQIKGGNTLAFTAKATDVDVPKDTLTYDLYSFSNTSATINPATGAFSWTTPVVAQPTSYLFVIEVDDNQGGNNEQEFLVRVLPGNPVKVNGVTFTAKLQPSYSYPFGNPRPPFYTVLYTVTNNTPFYLRDLKIAGSIYGDPRDLDYVVRLDGDTIGQSGDDDDDDDDYQYDVVITDRKTPFTSSNFVLAYVGEEYGRESDLSTLNHTLNGNGLEPGQKLEFYLQTYLPSTAAQLLNPKNVVITIAGPASVKFVCDPVNKPANTPFINGKLSQFLLQ